MTQNRVLYLSERDVDRVLSRRDVIEMVESIFRQAGEEQIILGTNSFLPTGDGKHNQFIAMPVSIPQEKVLGLKWINIYEEPAPGFPFSHGNLVLVNHTETGSPLAIVSATNITTMRTAGGHGVVAARHLARKNPKVLTIIGCGGQGRNGAGGFLEEFPSLEEIRLYDAYPEACQRITDQFSGKCRFVIAKTAREAVEGCDILMTCSSSREVLVQADWIQPGTTVIAINAFQDLDPAITYKADRWILGSYQEDTHNILNNPDRSHGQALESKRIQADLTEVIRGLKPGRTAPQEIVLYSHMGMGAFDVACAHVAYQRAVEQGLGTVLPL